MSDSLHLCGLWRTLPPAAANLNSPASFSAWHIIRAQPRPLGEPCGNECSNGCYWAAGLNRTAYIRIHPAIVVRTSTLDSDFYYVFDSRAQVVPDPMVSGTRHSRGAEADLQAGPLHRPIRFPRILGQVYRPGQYQYVHIATQPSFTNST